MVDKTEDSKDVFDPLTVDYVREHCQQAEEIECRARAAQEMVVSKYIIFELQHIVTLCILYTITHDHVFTKKRNTY